MNDDIDDNDPASELPGMNLGALVDSRVDDTTIRHIQSMSTAATIYYAAADYPKRDARIKNLANQLLTGQIDMIVFLTAAGLNQFIERCALNVSERRVLDMLSDISSVAVGKLVAGRMRELNITPTVEITQSDSWRDVIVALDANCQLTNKRIGLESNQDIHSLSAGLEARGADVVRIESLLFEQTDPSASEQDMLDAIEDNQLDAILLPSALSAARFAHLIQHRDRQAVRENSRQLVVLAIGNETAELLKDRGMICDMVISDQWVPGLPENIRVLQDHKEKSRQQLSGPASSNLDSHAPWFDSPFLRAIRLQPNQITPIWLMRQAGSHIKEYRDIREKVSFRELCQNPQLCSEVTCKTVERLGVDAASVFSDLLLMLEPMGCRIEFIEGRPVISNPIESAMEVDRIRPLENMDRLNFVLDAVRQTRADLAADIPLVGIAGAPFTLASYLIEGEASHHYARTKSIMCCDAGAWGELMQNLANSILIYLDGQIQAGAQCVQLVDSSAGCLGYDDYVRYVHPYVAELINKLSAKAPVINFATANPALLSLYADTVTRVVGIDWRIRLDQAWKTIGYDRAVQGNLDPVVLFSGAANIRLQAQHVLNQAENRPGHIFNLGHSILPHTPVENVIALVDAVHELSQNGHQ